MKTTIEVNGFEIKIEEMDGKIMVSAMKDDEVVEEFELESEGMEGDEDFDDDEMEGDDDEMSSFGEDDDWKKKKTLMMMKKWVEKKWKKRKKENLNPSTTL